MFIVAALDNLNRRTGMNMKRLWITYAWKDDEQADVQFLVQELSQIGVDAQIDKYTLGAGRRLWTQIADKICDPAQSDAWAIYATENSLASDPCQEELAYALDRALRARGDSYPIIGIFPEHIGTDLVPPAIRTRLYVSLQDADWKERIKAACEGREVAVARPALDNIFCRSFEQWGWQVFEVRPRIGKWYPAVFMVPTNEADRLQQVWIGRAGEAPNGVSGMHQTGFSQEGWTGVRLRNEITPTFSMFAFFSSLPSQMRAGSPEVVFTISPR